MLQVFGFLNLWHIQLLLKIEKYSYVMLSYVLIVGHSTGFPIGFENTEGRWGGGGCSSKFDGGKLKSIHLGGFWGRDLGGLKW